jgi:DNA polymerase (family 10)
MPELLAALHEQRLRDLNGWGERSETNLAAAIRRSQEAGGPIPLAVALDLAEDLVGRLAEVPGVERATYAGSLRRMRDTLGDIDVLVAAPSSTGVMDVFCSLPQVGSVLAHGTTRSAIVTTSGIQVDLWVIDPHVWGAALLYFTGSKPHNVRVRELAVRQGLKLSEYGLFRVDDDRLLASRTEEKIYAVLGLPWIPPTLREDRGEVEAALQGALPDVVELADVGGDLHMHTDLTDGLASAADMIGPPRHGATATSPSPTTLQRWPCSA